jgi:hypothetical protein
MLVSILSFYRHLVDWSFSCFRNKKWCFRSGDVLFARPMLKNHGQVAWDLLMVLLGFTIKDGCLINPSTQRRFVGWFCLCKVMENHGRRWRKSWTKTRSIVPLPRLPERKSLFRQPLQWGAHLWSSPWHSNQSTTDVHKLGGYPVYNRMMIIYNL